MLIKELFELHIPELPVKTQEEIKKEKERDWMVRDLKDKAKDLEKTNHHHDAWQKILFEWKQVNHMRRLNQRLYDQLGGAIMYILHYAEKNEIILPSKDTLFRMIDNVHDVTGRIKQFHKEINTKSDDRIQPDKDH